MKYLESDIGYSITEFRTQLIFLLSPTVHFSPTYFQNYVCSFHTMKDQRDTCPTKPTRDMGQRNNSPKTSQSSIIIFLTLEDL